MECEHRQRLSAFHDGELSSSAASEMERHLESCPQCAAALAEIRDVTRSFAGFANEPLPSSLLVGAQETVARFALEGTSPIVRIASVLTALAASILIVASAWLWDGPAPEAGPRRVAVNAAPEWERMAVALDIEPLEGDAAGTPEAIALAESRLADWMLDNLSR